MTKTNKNILARAAMTLLLALLGSTGAWADNDAKIRGTLLTQFHFAIYSLYDSVTDTCQP